MDKKLRKAILKANKSVWAKENAKKVTKKGLYEVWYTMVDDLEREEAYWIRYTLMCPKTGRKPEEGQSLEEFIDSLGGDGMLWMGYFNNKDPSQNEMVKTSFHLSSVKGTEGNNIAQIDDSTVSLEGIKGGFETSTGRKISWDLHFSQFQDPYITTPNIAKTLGITNTLAKAAHPNIRISGEITRDGQTTHLKEVPGIQYHTLGDGYKVPWEWASAHTFENAPRGYLDFGAKKQIGKATVELYDGQKRLAIWNDKILKKLKLAKQVEFTKSLTGIEFALEYKNLSMEGRISVPSEKLLGVEYVGPLGNSFYCYNSELADCTVEITYRDEEGQPKDKKKFIAQSSVSFETIYDTPQESVPYLPWDKEEL